jgi:hypothetical protein
LRTWPSFFNSVVAAADGLGFDDVLLPKTRHAAEPDGQRAAQAPGLEYGVERFLGEDTSPRGAGRGTGIRSIRGARSIAEVEVNLFEAPGGWAPYQSLDDAYKLDDVQEALRMGDVKRASQLSTRFWR